MDMAQIINEEMGMKKRESYYDVLNIMACVMVVALHCHGDFFNYSNTWRWVETLGVQVIAHWAVPIFYMLSGATLMGYRESYDTKTFFEKRIFHVVIPFFLWKFIYLVIYLTNGSYIYTGMRTLLSDYFTNAMVGIFWFFFPLFGLYLSIPVLSLFAKEKYLFVFKYIIIVSFVIYSVLPCLSSILRIQFGAVTFPIGGNYLMYGILGYYLSKVEISRHHRRFIYVAGVVGAIIMAFYTYVSSKRIGDVDLGFMEYEYVPTFLMAVALFVAVKNLRIVNQASNRVKNILKILAGTSFGVYLIHIFFVEMFFDKFGTSVRSMVTGTILIYVFCVVLVLCFKRIPFLKRLMP